MVLFNGVELTQGQYREINAYIQALESRQELRKDLNETEKHQLTKWFKINLERTGKLKGG